MKTEANRQIRRILGVSVVLLAPLGLWACAASQKSEVSMEHACQFKACVCSDDDAPLLSTPETVDLKWRDNGDAYCPEGYSLTFDD